jgi:hypothetical protein
MNFPYKAVHLVPLFIILLVFIVPLLGPGLIVGGDWTLPYSNQELRVFGDRALSVWSRVEIPFGTQVSHNNLYLFQILARLWSSVGLDGVSFQKTGLFLTIIGIYFFSYRLFLKLTQSRFASIVGAMSYLFSPIVFNYLNMGWNYVLLFLALAPLFVQIALDYFKGGGKKYIIALGLISAISFFQSQSIVWLPLIFICTFIAQVTRENLLKSIMRLGFASIGIVMIVLIVHLPWLLPLILGPNNIISSTSAVDLKRFSEVLSIPNQLRLWGSLYNQEFETAFPPSLAIFSYLPIIICLATPLFSSLKKKLSIYILVLLLIIVAPTLYINRDFVAQIPLSTVIRDVSRFLVITSLGISMGIALSLCLVKIRALRFVICLMLIISSSPFFLGRLYTLTGNPSPQDTEYKDFRVSLLTFPDLEKEPDLIPLFGKTNVFLPTGGFIFTRSDKRFARDFWGVADIQSNFSPLASGIYYTEKSDPLVSSLTQSYINVSSEVDKLTALFRIYGVDNLFYRSGLESTYNSPLDRDGVRQECQSIKTQSDSDWAVTSICHIKDSYPLIYSSVSPQYSTKTLSELIPGIKDAKDRVVFLGCPISLGFNNEACGANRVDNYGQTLPELTFQKISDTEYSVKAENINGKYLLVFNQTYHPGWVISTSVSGKLNYHHLLVNQLVNGWMIDPEGDSNTAEYIIEFYPQKVYSKLLPISLVSIFFMLLYLIRQSKPRK